jgi:hypothetical protein
MFVFLVFLTSLLLAGFAAAVIIYLTGEPAEVPGPNVSMPLATTSKR